MSRSLRLYKRSPSHPAWLMARTPSNLTSDAHPGPPGTGRAVASIGGISPPAADPCPYRRPAGHLRNLRRHPTHRQTQPGGLRTHRGGSVSTWPRRGANAVCWHRGAMQRYEYQVQQLRESMIGGKLSSDKLERLLNDEARKGWQLKAITSADVKGRVGPGGVEGLIITFERPVG